jgi:beta-mannanase
MSKDGRLLNVKTVSPYTTLSAAIERNDPANFEDWWDVGDTIQFPNGKNYFKVNNTEKCRYEDVTTDLNDVAFREVERGVLADYINGYYCGDGIDPRTDVPFLQGLLGDAKPIQGIINYQAAIETGLSSYPWYDWLYENGMILQFAFEPKNPGKGNEEQPEWSLRSYIPGRVSLISTVARSSNVATIVTTAAHGLVTGEYVVTRAQDTDFNETDDGNPVTVVNATTFTYSNTGDDVSTKSDYGITHRIHYNKDISTVARSSNVATIVTSAAHALITGDKVDISAVDTSFNEVNVSITKVNSTTFTFANTGGDVSSKSDAGLIRQAGYHDTDFIKWNDSIVSFCEGDDRVIYIRPMSEMNGTWTTWGKDANGNVAGDYIPSWKHLHDLFARDGAGAYLKWIWCPVTDLTTGDADWTFDNCYPGNSYVDIMGMNGYNWGDISWSYWRDFIEIFKITYDEAVSRLPSSMDFLICEIGCNSTGGQKDAWITDAAYQMRYNYTRFIGAFWFNMTEPTDATIDLRWNQTQLTIDAYKETWFWRKDCTWCGTADCIHRRVHGSGSEILGMGPNPPDTEPVKKKRRGTKPRR